MKNKLISILGNGLPWGLAFFALASLIGHVGNLGLHNTLKISAFVAVAALLVNGLIYTRFSKPLKKLEALSVTLTDSELLLLQAPANHLVEGSLVPGKLFLTDKRLVFKPFSVAENEPEEYTWYTANLRPDRFYKSLWNTGGEFLLSTGDDVPVMFEVDKLKPWKEALRGL